MTKNYLKKQKSAKFRDTPKEETIKFLLDYSKSKKFVQTKKSKEFFELNLN